MAGQGGAPNSTELKHALAVQMRWSGHSYREIRDILQVLLGFITTQSRLQQSEHPGRQRNLLFKVSLGK